MRAEGLLIVRLPPDAELLTNVRIGRGPAVDLKGCSSARATVRGGDRIGRQFVGKRPSREKLRRTTAFPTGELCVERATKWFYANLDRRIRRNRWLSLGHAVM